MSISKVEEFYHQVYTNQNYENDDDDDTIRNFFVSFNPPPDTLIKIRATAFKIAGQYLSLQDDHTVLVNKIRLIVTAIEDICYNLKLEYRNNDNNDFDNDDESITSFFHSLFDGETLDTEENEKLLSFLKESSINISSFPTKARSLAFTVGIQHFNTETTHNEQMLRCMNVIIHAIEATFYQPKSYQIQLSSLSSYASAMVNNSAGIGAEVDENTGSGGYKSGTVPTIRLPDVDLSNMKLNDAIQQLWDYDTNRLVMNDDIQLNVQNSKKPYVKVDGATEPLFTNVEDEVWQRSTYSTFVRLLDNYTSFTGTAEQISSIERSEIDHFLATIMETAPMQFCYEYCKAHNIESTSSKNEFIELLYTIWFELYCRDGAKDSSGFEHVFIGEIKDNEISGFHNWIQFYLQEKKGHIDYRGYIKPRGQHANSQQQNYDNKSDDHVLTLQFAWKTPDGTYFEKFVGTMFIGVSPEFEFALYTICFLFGEEENYITLDTGVDVFELVIKCYKMGRNKIGTTFPEVRSHCDENDD